MNLNGMVSLWKVRELVDKATNIVMNYTETEAKVREATNDDPWGPSGQQMQEISAFTFTYEAFPEAMGMLWKRMFQENKQNWRRVYKSLLLLDYLLKNGSERVVTSAREHLYDLRSLENFTFVDDMGKDQGINIRHKVTELLEFIQDDERLRDERKKAKKNKDKYIGMSSDSMGFRAGGGGGNWDSGWKSSTGGNFGSTSGKYDSDDDDRTSEQSASGGGGVSEFKDDDFNPRKSPRGLPRKPSGGAADFSSKPTISGATKPTKSSKPSRKVDLGAAAAFASKAKEEASIKQSSRTVENNNQMMDVFFTESNPKPSQLDHEVDDFDPRSGESKPAVVDSFGGFAAVPSPAPGDGFADFSSAFGGETAAAPAAQDLFSDFNAGPSNPPPAAGSAGLDLFGGVDINPPSTPSFPAPVTPTAFPAPVTPTVAAAPSNASSMDLLGGLDFNSGSSLPPMQSGGMQPMAGLGGISGMGGGMPMSPNPMMGLGASPSLSMNQGQGMLGGAGPASLPLQPSSALTPSAGPMSSQPQQPSAAQPVNVGSTWSDLGNLNNSLLNFSLNPGTTKTASVPMNSMPAPIATAAQIKSGVQATTSNNNNNFANFDSLL